MKRWHVASILIVGFLLSGEMTCGQTLYWLGAPTNDYESYAQGVSADGCVVVGWTTVFGETIPEAFRWRRASQQMGVIGGYNSEANAVSRDGRRIVGVDNNEAVVWTESGSQSIPLNAVFSGAADISPDGRWIAGGATFYDEASNTLVQRAFLWDDANQTSILLSTPGLEATASGVSADGRVVVGQFREEVCGEYENGECQWWYSVYRGYRWVAGVGAQDLGTFGGELSAAHDVSAEGSVVVGWAYNASNQQRAFRWAGSGLVDLGTLGGAESVALAVSADGSVVVGQAQDPSNNWRAFRWRQGQMENLNTAYASLLGSGSFLEAASALSPDARFIAGWGYNAATGRLEGFLLDTWRYGDTNGDGCVDDADLLAVLFSFGASGTGDSRYEELNCDGVVDDADLLTVLFNFGNGC